MPSAEQILNETLASVRRARTTYAMAQEAGAPEYIMEMGRESVASSMQMLGAAIAIPMVAKLMEERPELAQEVADLRAVRH